MADIEPLAVPSDCHTPAIAGHAPNRFRGNRSSIIQRSRKHPVWRQRILIHVQHDLEALAAISSGHVAGQVALGQRDVTARWSGDAAFPRA